MARRVVAKIEFHCGELFLRVAFIVTTLETDSRAVMRFYNKRGTAEQWIKEGKLAVMMTRLSVRELGANAAIPSLAGPTRTQTGCRVSAERASRRRKPGGTL